MIQRHLQWRLYHITNQINESARQVEEANETLSGLRKSVVRLFYETGTSRADL